MPQTGEAMNRPGKLLKPEEVAEWLGMSPAWVRDHATRRDPRIPVIRLGGKRARMRFQVDAVRQYIAQHLVEVDASRESV
jgi:predicted DNA-binding transcriptional regulator AlpA